MSRSSKFLGAVTAAMIVAVLAATLLITPPGQMRNQRLDDERVRQLVQIAESIDRYWSNEERLPETLAALRDEGYRHLRIADPESGSLYGYRLLAPTDASSAANGADAATSFELCASFATDTREREYGIWRRRYYGIQGKRQWHHAAGRQCFSLEAKKLK